MTKAAEKPYPLGPPIQGSTSPPPPGGATIYQLVNVIEYHYGVE